MARDEVTYTVGSQPTAQGVYACRVCDAVNNGGFQRDEFLHWVPHHFSGYWTRTAGGSALNPDHVVGWIGPLERRIKAKEPRRHPPGLPQRSYFHNEVAYRIAYGLVQGINTDDPGQFCPDCGHWTKGLTQHRKDKHD